jgi:branched-subunit amino acid ABC-type transport system permease component
MIFCYSALISLLGLALVLRHRVSDIPDFSIIVYVWLGVFSSGVAVNLGLNLYFGPVLALAAGCLLGWTQYQGIVGVMERRRDDAVHRTLSTIGVEIIGGALLWIGAYWLDYYQSTLSTHIFHAMTLFDFELFGVRGIFYVIPLVSLGIYSLLLLLWRKTAFGATLVASGENPELAMIQGVDPWKMKVIAWTLTGGLACVAGSLFPPFLHLDPGGSTYLMVSILAVGVLSGFESLPLAVAAAYIVGVTELGLTLWVQIHIGSWLGEFRPIIPSLVIYFAMLLIPRGLIDLKKSALGAVNYMMADRRRALTIIAVVVGIAFISFSLWGMHLSAVDDERAGWVNVSNKIGRAGASLCSDRPSVDLPESLYFENVYPPETLSEIHGLVIFAETIKHEKATVVYIHEGKVYLIVDEKIGYYYDPYSDNFGR